MINKLKMAYLMHVDWNWIKQRPHFLYEELTHYYSIDLFYIEKLYDKQLNKIRNSHNIHSDSIVNKLKKIPLSGRFRALQRVERILNRRTINSLYQYEYLWITSPLILDFIPLDQLEDKIVIYDCMDDFLEFYPNFNEIDRLRELETRLVQKAKLVFTSSIYLKEKMVKTYRDFLNSEPIVVNNGISPTLFKQRSFNQPIQGQVITSTSNYLKLMYIGTIADWIDFKLILYILEQIPEVMITMIGPIETKVPVHPRIHYEGVVEHDQLASHAHKADALVMPFVLNELIRAVDPVKIYEYIYFHKPIIAIDYSEMHKFLPYVSLYSSKEEFIKLVMQVKDDEYTLYNETYGLNFLSNNTWQERCKQIVEFIEETV